MNSGDINFPKETNHISSRGTQSQFLSQIEKTHEEHGALIDGLREKFLTLREEAKIPKGLTSKELKTLSNFEKEAHQYVSRMERETESALTNWTNLSTSLSQLKSPPSEDYLKRVEDCQTTINNSVQWLVKEAALIQERVDLLQDVRTEISSAKNHYQALKSEYQEKQNALFKNGCKELSNTSVIENQLKGIKDHTRDLEALEKKLRGKGVSIQDSELIDQGKSELSTLSSFIQLESKIVSESMTSNET